MTGHVLTLNAGSSSIKFALLERHGDLTVPQLTGKVGGVGMGSDSMTQAQAALHSSPGALSGHHDELFAAGWLDHGRPAWPASQPCRPSAGLSLLRPNTRKTCITRQFPEKVVKSGYSPCPLYIVGYLIYSIYLKITVL